MNPRSPQGPPNTVGLNIYSPVSKGPWIKFLLTPPDLHWRSSTAFGIQRSVNPEIWHAGHVNAILADGPVAIVGAETGGVWLINPVYDAIPQSENFPAQSLSWDWANPDVTTLAAGPEGMTTVYAGGGWLDGANSSLHVISLAGSLGEMTFIGSAEISVPWGMSINQIVVQSSPRRIVLASSDGVWWSAIPTSTMNAGAYRWHKATGGPGSPSGIALGPDGTVVAAETGDGIAGSPTTGFYVGKWSGSKLSFTKSTITGAAPAMTRTSIASSKNQPSVLYAVAADKDDQNLGGVFRSSDGGATFTACQLPEGAGNQGFYNNCVDVHPDNADIVAVGWRTGPFVSTDRGQSWKRSTDEPNGHMHSDVHALTFAETSDGVYLWAGTDGGVCLSTDNGATWDSRYNKHLRNIQYYGPVDQNAMSTFDASRWEPGLHGGATQDNGNLWARSGDEGTRSSIRQFEGGDGNTVMFVTETIVLHRNNTLTRDNGKVEFGNRIRRSNYDPAAHDMDNELGTVVPAEGYPDGMPFPSAAAVVTDPHYKRDGARMLAVVGKGTEVHGYFDSAAPGAFRKLGDVGPGASTPDNPRSITAIASYNGFVVLAGTSDGHVYAVEAASGAVTDEPTSFGGWAGSSVSKLIWPAPTQRYGTLANSVVFTWNPLLSTSPTAKPGVWLLTTGTLTSGATDIEYAALATGGAALFACTDFGVEVSIDDGGTWTDVGSGLPARPHCRDIRLGINAAGKPALFIATYGWGAFIAELPGKPENPLEHVPSLVAKILFGIVADGQGVEIINGHIHVVPPREPARDLAIALAFTVLAQHLSGPGARLTARMGEQMMVIAGIENAAGFGGQLRDAARHMVEQIAEHGLSQPGQSGALERGEQIG